MKLKIYDKGSNNPVEIDTDEQNKKRYNTNTEMYRLDKPHFGFEYFNNIYEISVAVYNLIISNLGLGKFENSYKVFVRGTKMNKEDYSRFMQLSNKYKFEVLNTPFILFDEHKKWLLEQNKILVEHVIAANTIYPSNEYEINNKRKHINDAIIACEMMIQITQITSQIIKIPHEAIKPFVKLILNQKDQLKKWKVSCTKLFLSIKVQEEIEREQISRAAKLIVNRNKNCAECPVEFIEDNEFKISLLKHIQKQSEELGIFR